MPGRLAISRDTAVFRHRGGLWHPRPGAHAASPRTRCRRRVVGQLLVRAVLACDPAGERPCDPLPAAPS